ncbi:MAG: single-stranded-DNA-specific exonuclease RecJ [Xanthomonadaceae bacterium]|nr:single-stranded-DNA-specific exonuclease RecJ [Xanthomonadaceae bacterium]
MGISPIVAEIFLRRGIDQPEDIGRFLSPSLSHLPDPNLLKGMEKAVKRLLQAMERHEKVLVYGDYDVDGISSTVILVQFFRQVGLHVFYHIPSRLQEGYGLNGETIREYAKEGVSLLVTVDCGISNIDEVACAASLHMDTIITDHHEPPAEIPAAYAIINPKQADCPYPEKNLAGVGVAFNLLVACRRAMREAGMLSGEINLKRYLDMVALGTVADVMPLTGVNRIFVKYGLEEIASAHRPGIEALLTISRVDRSVGITARDIAFKLAPRLNAAGRMDSVHDAMELLLTDDAAVADEQAYRLQQLNLQRRKIEEVIFEEVNGCMAQDRNYGGKHVTVLASSDWHEGVIGIVASKIAERYFQPTMLISMNKNGVGKASGRSIPGIHLLDMITQCSEHLHRFGGHQMAVGFSIDHDKLESFRHQLDSLVGEHLQSNELQQTLEVDGRLNLGDLSFQLLQDLAQLAPFGFGNPEPIFMAEELEVNRASIVGRNHLRLDVRDHSAKSNAIGFNMGDRQISAGDRIALAFVPQINTWNGNQSIQLNLKDIRRL